MYSRQEEQDRQRVEAREELIGKLRRVAQYRPWPVPMLIR
jgi:hypothetical protein